MIEVKIVPKIRERLREMGHTTHWLSEQTGIDPASICRIASGKGVNLETAFSIAAALGLPIEKVWVAEEVEVD